MPTDLTIGQLYYAVIKHYGLPIRHHGHVKKKIKDLSEEIPEIHAKHYLQALLTRDLRLEKGEFKPVLTESLDIYSKRLKIEDYLRRNKPVITGKTAKLLAEQAAKRAVQWED